MAYAISGQINSDQIKKAWDAKLRKQSVLNDFMSGIEGNINPNKTKNLPETVVYKVTASPGEDTQTLSLITPFSGAGITGTTPMFYSADAVDNEDSAEFRTIKLYSDVVGNAFKVNKWGRQAFQEKFYALAAQYEQLMGLWHRETRGAYIREAVCENFSGNLSEPLTDYSETKYPNRNVIIAGSVVDYSRTLATYAGNINTAWTGASDANKNISTSMLSTLDYLAGVYLVLEPILIGGMEGYILTIPSYQATKLRDPSNSVGLVELFKYTEVQNFIKGNYLGTWGRLHLVEDVRSPTCKIAVAPSVTFKYKQPGRGATDGRDAAAADVAGVGMILGKGAIYHYQQEDTHWEQRIDENYGRVPGMGAFANYGYRSAEYDKVGSAVEAERVNDYSALVFFGTTT